MNIVAVLLLCIVYANGYRDYETRMVGGKIAPAATFPFVVSLRQLKFYEDRYYEFFCTGSIINARWVLTAAHCVFDKPPVTIRSVPYIMVDAGSNKLSQMRSRHSVRKIFTHPGFHQTQEIIKNDLALLQLDAPFQFSKTIQPITLGYYYTDEADHHVLAVGFGRTYEDINSVDKNDDLRYLFLKTMDLNRCRSIHAQVGNEVDDFMHICVIGQKGQSSCYGDSGSPLVDFQTGFQVGVFSGLEDCSGAYPALYINLKHYLPWIGNITRNAQAYLH